MSRRFLWVMMALAFLGFLDATYLAIEHLRGVVPPCTVLSGCEVVTTSNYATVLGMPVALMGSFYYAAILIALMGVHTTGRARLLLWIARATALGFAASVYFVTIQLFVLDAVCVYCMGSALTSTLLFACGMHLLRQKRILLS